LRYDETLAAMKALADKVCRLYADCKETGHPIDLSTTLEPHYFTAAQEVTDALQLKEPIPRLCALVVASPFDAALHDAFGKVHGDDLHWDIERVVRVDRVTSATQQRRGVATWCYSLDFNERCANVGYLLEFLGRVKEQAPRGFERVAYIEQPTARDLAANRHN